MAKFSDASGRDWTFSITVDSAKTIRDDVGLDIMSIKDVDQFAEIVGGDSWAVLDAVALLCEPSFERHGVTAKTFFESLDGDAVESAVKAFVEAVIDFFPQRRREALKTLLAKFEAIEAAAVKRLKTEIETADADQLAETIVSTLGA